MQRKTSSMMIPKLLSPRGSLKEDLVCRKDVFVNYHE